MSRSRPRAAPSPTTRFPHPTQGGGNRGWWPERLNLKILAKNPAVANPLGEDFDYAAAFNSLDLAAVKQDIEEVLTTSQDWWPADFGHYGPFMIRMAWHSAGTYRISDGRGGAGAGQQRFAPLNCWPDNGNLDKARRLLWPVKKKYGQTLSWADLMVLTGNVALESMGFETFGFAGGRPDVWEPDEDVYWGPETEWLGDERYTGERELEKPLGAVQMGLIYVNPEGPNGNPDPLAAAHDIRETFSRMAMNDEETVALIAGGHTFGKTHGAADPDEYVGREPEGALDRGAWASAGRTPSAPARARTRSPPASRSPGRRRRPSGATASSRTCSATSGSSRRAPPARNQWVAKDGAGAGTIPGPADGLRQAPADDAHDRPVAALRPGVREDLAPLPREPGRARRRVRARLVQAHAPRHGPDPALPRPGGPGGDADLAGPGPRRAPALGADDVAALKQQILESGLSVSELVAAAWASASTFRGSDKRGGANGARIRLEPQIGWEVNNPAQLAKVLGVLEGIQAGFGKPVSLADLIVLGGSAAVEKAAADGGVTVEVPFTAGTRRRDAGVDRRRLLRAAGADRGRLPQLLPRRGATGCRPSTCCSTARTCSR